MSPREEHLTDTRVVDTNVLIVASAADESSPFRPDATPVDEAQYRQVVLDWFIAFEQDATRWVVLDHDWHIMTEYQHKLGEQDYGLLALLRKLDRQEVAWVGFAVDADHHAVLPAALLDTVHDLADRKMVAAVLAARDAGHPCRLVNACDTDWLDDEDGLRAAGVEMEHLLEDEWLRPRWLRKRAAQ